MGSAANACRVRHQGIWNRLVLRLSESLAHLLCYIKRLLAVLQAPLFDCVLFNPFCSPSALMEQIRLFA